MEELPLSDPFLESIKRLKQLGNSEFVPSDEDPIFLLAVGWGTGSTLLQRILMTDKDLLLWGEPYGRMGLISSWTKALSMTDAKWPKKAWFDPDPEREQWEKGVANFYPEPGSLLNGVRAMMEEWLTAPAKNRGYSRWGFKEVRLTAADAHMLQMIFPRARFVVLVRDPMSGFQSFRAMKAYWRYDHAVQGVQAYARYWNTVAAGWLNTTEGVDHRVLRFEDLVSGSFDFRSLEQWLGLELREDLALKVVLNKKAKKAEPSLLEKWVIRREAGESMRRLNYLDQDVERT